MTTFYEQYTHVIYQPTTVGKYYFDETWSSEMWGAYFQGK